MIHQEVFGLIYASEDNYNLRDLVAERSIGALPVGGRYRAIDFTLSNMVDSGIRNIGVITRRNYKSLMDHLSGGKPWDLSRKQDGLSILPPFDSVSNTGIYQGLCDAVYNKLDFLHYAPQEYCLITGSYTIYSASFSEMYEEHLASRADITMLYSTEENVPVGERYKDVRIYTDGNGRVTDMEYDSAITHSNKLGMDIYLVRKDLLETLVRNACARGQYNFVVDVLIPNLKNLNIRAIPHKGYVGRLTSLNSFFNLNMDMLKKDVQKDLFGTHPVYTRIRDEIPVKYGSCAKVSNTVMGDGCEINGTVENCVLFRGARIGKGAFVRDSIIMRDADIQDGCILQNVIIDKNAEIRSGIQLMGAPGFPVVVRKGAIV